MKLITLLLFTFLGFSTTPNLSQEAKQQAPEISLQNPDGQQINLSDLRGNIVLVDFWASWCAPCRKRHPELTGVYNKFNNREFKNADRFEIFSVSLDRSTATKEHTKDLFVLNTIKAAFATPITLKEELKSLYLRKH